MRKSRLSKSKQIKLIEFFIAGSTARTASTLAGVNKNTAAYYFKRLRELIYEYQEQLAIAWFEGEIEVDGEKLSTRDAIGISNANEIEIKANTSSKFLVMEIPMKN